MISPRRLKALIWKEILQISRDPSSILIAFLLPLLLLFIFGYGISLDTRNVRVGLVVEGTGTRADRFASTLQGSTYLDVRQGKSAREMEMLLVAGGFWFMANGMVASSPTGELDGDVIRGCLLLAAAAVVMLIALVEPMDE